LTSDSGGVSGAPETLATADSQTSGAPALPSSAAAVTGGVHQQVGTPNPANASPAIVGETTGLTPGQATSTAAAAHTVVQGTSAVQARNAVNREGVKKDILQGAKLAAYEGQVMHGEVGHEKTEDGAALTHGYDAVAGTVVMAAAGVLSKGAEAIAAYKAAKAALTPERNIPTTDGPDDTGPYKPMNGMNNYGGSASPGDAALAADDAGNTLTYTSVGEAIPGLASDGGAIGLDMVPVIGEAVMGAQLAVGSVGTTGGGKTEEKGPDGKPFPADN
jgi:hypothetical protein